MSSKEVYHNALLEKTNIGLTGLLGQAMQHVSKEEADKVLADILSGLAVMRFNTVIDPKGMTVVCHLKYQNGMEVSCFEDRADFKVTRGDIH